MRIVTENPGTAGRHVTASADRTLALHDYIAVVRHRKWIIIAAVILAPLAAILYSLAQTPVYEGSAKVLLSRENLANTLTGAADPNGAVENQTLMQTQADVARVPEIAKRVIDDLGIEDMTPGQFLDQSSVSAAESSEILTFAFRDDDQGLAAAAATAYAHEYVDYRHQIDAAPLRGAREQVTKRLEQLSAAGEEGSSLYASLAKRDQELATREALQTSNANVIQSADGASQVLPRTTLNAVGGLLFGIVVGLGLAFLREALDTRVRSADQVGERLGIPLLARIPEPPKKLREEAKLVSVAEPRGGGAEAFRMLRTNIEFATLDRDVNSIMVTSALDREGKSTTVANLAVAFARAGRHVILVDLDLRRPYVDRFFDLQGTPGVTQVILGRAELEGALTRVPIMPDDRDEPSRDPDGIGSPQAYTSDTNGAGGQLEVLTSGPIPPDPGEFVATRKLATMLDQLRKRADLVLIDSPPLLQVGDAMTLSSGVDAVVLVTRLKILRRGPVSEAHRLLDTMRARKLGFVVTGAQTEHGYYGYGYGFGAGRALADEPQREGNLRVGHG